MTSSILASNEYKERVVSTCDCEVVRFRSVKNFGVTRMSAESSVARNFCATGKHRIVAVPVLVSDFDYLHLWICMKLLVNAKTDVHMFLWVCKDFEM